MSLEPELFKLHFKSIKRVVDVIKTIDLDTVNAKTLAFLISLFGKTSLHDDVVYLLRDKIYEAFKKRKANIFDIVETFNTMMILNKLTSEDLKKTGLDQDFTFANQISKNPKIIQNLRYFELLAIAQIEEEALWGAYLDNIYTLNFKSLNIMDTTVIETCLQFILGSSMKSFSNGASQLQKEIAKVGERIKSELKQSQGGKENIYIKYSQNENRLIEVVQSQGNHYIFSFNVPNTRFVADLFHTPTNTVIEVNGPSHYIKHFEANSIVVTEKLNGRSTMKFNKIKIIGYNVAAINFQ